MSVTGKEYRLAIRIAGIIDKSFSTSLVAAGGTLRKTVSAVDKDFTKLDRGFDAIMGFGSKAFHAVATAATVAATAIGAATAAAINVGMEFEKQMSAVQAISGASADELAQLTDKARELGQTSVFSATEVGKAMEYMGMAGWKTEQMLAGIGGVLNLAAASGEELAAVSDIVTDVLTAFHMEAEETTRMVDVMAQAAMNSNTNVAMMGETFKYAGTVAGAMGYQIEDMAIATGLMASSGIKASNAGTALRNIITRMAKPTKESAEAMEALGLSLTRDDGSMYSFLEIMEQMRKGMSGMTETQKAYYAAELGGQRGMPGLLAIANSTDRQFKELTESIYNAEGAAQQMADIRMDNLAGDVQIFKDALADAGIELSQELNGPLRGLVSLGTEFVNGAETQIPKAVNKISAEFLTLQRKFKKFAQPVFSGIVDGGKWIVKHGKGIISVLAGIGAALAAYKAASTITHIVNAIMSLGSLNPVTLEILGVVAAIGLLVGTFAAYKQHEQELVDQSLASHFGSIALSMEELQKVAEYIVSSESLGGVKKALDAFEGLDEYAAIMENAVSEIDKMNWQVSIGMKLTEDEQESYQQAIDNYVNAAQNYALQGQYAVSLNLSAVFDDSDLEQSNIVDKISAFYSDKYSELESLGTQLKDAVTEAFKDGLLEIDEAETIRNLQRQMAEIQRQLALGDYEGTLASIVQDFSGKDLNADTFRNLQGKLESAAGAVSDTYRDTYKNMYSEATAAYSAGYLNEEQYQQALDEGAAFRNNGIAEANLRALRFQLNTVMEAYSDEIAQYQEAVNSALAEMGDPSYAWDWENRPVVMWDSMLQDIYSAGPSKESKKAIEQVMEDMASQIEDINSLFEEWDTLSPAVQESLQAVLADISTLQGVTARRGDNLFGWGTSGDLEGLYQDVTNKVMESDYGNMKEWVDQHYEDLTGYIKTAAATSVEQEMDMAKIETIQPAVEGIYAYSNEYLQEVFSRNFSATADVAVTLNPIMKYRPTALPNLTGLNIDKNADGGIIRNKELSWLAEEGPEAVIPLDGSQNAVSLWEKAGQLLGMGSAFDDLDLDGGGDTVKVEYKPTLNFYGEAPSRDDLTDALDISQDKFDSMMDRYFKTHSRVSFG